MQINPDKTVMATFGGYEEAAFQSYQFMQINPDTEVILNIPEYNSEKVSIVSIHADQSRRLIN